MHRPGDHVRRRRHAAVAGVARKHAQAVRSAGWTRIRPSSKCSRASRTPNCSTARSSSPTPTSASSSPSSCARCGIEADIVLEPMRRDSGPAVAVAACWRAARDPDAIVLVLAADHVIRKPDEFRDACRQAAHRRRRGTDRDLRHRADPSGDQLRLHPAGRAAQRRRVPRSRRSSKSPTRDGRRLRRRALSLEQRQFPVSRRDHARRDRALRAGDGGGRQGSGRTAFAAISISCGSPPSRSRARRRSRSTMR